MRAVGRVAIRRRSSGQIAGMVVLLMALQPGSLSADAPRGAPERAHAETVVTRLQPGWNLVGWVGPEIPTADLFDTLPSVEAVWAWDAESQRYRSARRGSGGSLPTLTPGMGLWLLLGGDVVVSWTRPIEAGGAALRLRPGLNLVGVMADVSLDNLGVPVRTVARWDPPRRRYEHYRRADEALTQGDGLWIDVSEPHTLWQPGDAAPPVVFVGDVPEDIERTILTEYAAQRRFFAERFGVATRGPLQYIGVDADAVADIHYAVFGTALGRRPGTCGRTDGSVSTRALDCSLNRSAREAAESVWQGLEWNYVNALLRDVAGANPGLGTPGLEAGGPAWLFEGLRSYATAAHGVAEKDLDANRYREKKRGEATRTARPLRAFELPESSLASEIRLARDALGFLAVERLAQRAGDTALFDYLRLLRTASDWREAFETAFDIDVDDFYADFASYRREAVPPLPHLADDRDEAVLVIVEGVPSATAAQIRAEFGSVRRFFSERFAAAATEFTLYVAADAGSLRAAAPGWPWAVHCRDWPLDGRAILTLERCGDSLELDYLYIGAIIREFVTRQPIPPAGVAYGYAPRWLDDGAKAYAEVAYRAAAGRLSFADYRDLAVTAALHAPHRLESLDTPDEARAAGEWPTRALGFLAVEWLARHAGEPAVFEYYRVLPSSSSREAAFESAFGIALDEFYRQFAGYRAGLRSGSK